MPEMTVFEKIVDHYGAENQKYKAIEELSELIRAISRDDFKNIIEEIADVMIMIEQLKIIYRIDEQVIWVLIREKLSRTVGRMYDDRIHLEIEEIERGEK